MRHGAENRSLLHSLHQRYVEDLDNDPNTIENFMSDHLRMGGAFWGVGSLDILGLVPIDWKGHSAATEARQQSATKAVQRRDEVLRWIQSCWDPQQGGYGANVGHDAHITSTLVRHP